MPFKEAFPTKRPFAASIIPQSCYLQAKRGQIRVDPFLTRDSCPLFSCPCFPLLFEPRPRLSASCPLISSPQKSIFFAHFAYFVLSKISLSFLIFFFVYYFAYLSIYLYNNNIEMWESRNFNLFFYSMLQVKLKNSFQLLFYDSISQSPKSHCCIIYVK